MAKRYRFTCPNCGETYEMGRLAAAARLHEIGRGVYVRCPKCSTPNWVIPETLDSA